MALLLIVFYQLSRKAVEKSQSETIVLRLSVCVSIRDDFKVA